MSAVQLLVSGRVYQLVLAHISGLADYLKKHHTLLFFPCEISVLMFKYMY